MPSTVNLLLTTYHLDMGGVEQIISHPWFKSISFEKLLAKDLKPEFKPRLSKNVLDVSNFDEMFT